MAGIQKAQLALLERAPTGIEPAWLVQAWLFFAEYRGVYAAVMGRPLEKEP